METKDKDKNALSAGLLVLATATEMFMQKWLNSEKYTLSGESKMLYNGMEHGIKQARHFYERFTDRYTTVLYGMDKDFSRIDELRQNAAFIARLFFICLNLNNNGYSDEEIEKALVRLLEQEENPDLMVSQETINKFIIK